MLYYPFHFRTAFLLVFSFLCWLFLPSCTMGNPSDERYSYIVVPKDKGDSSDERAAEALAAYLKSRSRGGVQVFDSEEAGKRGPSIKIYLNVDPLLKNDFSVKNSQGSLFLSAKTYEKMLWLQYQFISRLGDNNLMLEASDLPPAFLSMKDTSGVFPFTYRNIYMPMNLDSDMTGVLGLHDINSWGLWGHNMRRVVKDASDEDIYAKINGKVHREQFCFSSQVLYESYVEYIEENFGFGEKHSYNFSVFPNDNSTVCQCSKCKKLGNREQDATPAVTRMVKRLAARFPGHNFFTSFYMTTRGIPDLKLDKNVGVILSAIELPRVSGLKNRPEYDFFETVVETWRERCDQVIVWDYISNFDDYLSPFPILRIMKERIAVYKDLKVTGLFFNGSGYEYSFMQEMKTSVLAALMINPGLNTDELVMSYLKRAMPVNWELVYNYYMDMEDRVEGNFAPVPLYGGVPEISRIFLDEAAFMDFYENLVVSDVCTEKEKAIVRRLKHDLAYTLLEIVRRGAGEGLVKYLDEEGNPLPYVMEALDNLGKKTSKNELPYLLCNSNRDMKTLDYVSESGLLISDYQAECRRWLETANWKDNLAFMAPVEIRSRSGERKREKMLSDGVEGLSKNYHWGWYIIRQQELKLCVPIDKIKGGRYISINFLNLQKHRISPPKVVQIVIDGKAVGLLGEFAPVVRNDGLIHTFSGEVDFSSCKEYLEIRIIPSGITRDMAFDEIIITK